MLTHVSGADKRFPWNIRIPRRFLAVSAFQLVLIQAAFIAIAYPFLLNPAALQNDASTYFAAAQRLNAGHDLYAIGAGDRAVAYTGALPGIVLVSHPTMAVVWRPLALLPGDTSMWLWWAFGLVAVLLTTWLLVRSGAWVPALVGVALGLDIGWTALSGNVNAFLLPILVGIWWCYRNERPIGVGILVGLAIGAKLTPALLLTWLLVTRQWRALTSAVACSLAIAAITVLGAGWSSIAAWLQVAATTTKAVGFNGGISSLIPSFGFPPVPYGLFVSAVTLLVCLTAFLARKHTGLVFATAVIGAALATPNHPGTLALLLPAVAPFAMPFKGPKDDVEPAAAAFAVAPP